MGTTWRWWTFMVLLVLDTRSIGGHGYAHFFTCHLRQLRNERTGLFGCTGCSGVLGTRRCHLVPLRQRFTWFLVPLGSGWRCSTELYSNTFCVLPYGNADGILGKCNGHAREAVKRQGGYCDRNRTYRRPEPVLHVSRPFASKCATIVGCSDSYRYMLTPI